MRSSEGAAVLAEPTVLSGRPSFPDRAAGALLGLAVGDALGRGGQGMRGAPGAVRHERMTDGGPLGLRPGVWAGDVGLALALGASLHAQDGLVPEDVMGRFARWWLAGQTGAVDLTLDMAPSTVAALRRFLAGGDPFCGDGDPASSSEAPLMRVAPVAVFRWGNSRLAREEVWISTSLTHARVECLEACDFLALLMIQALGGAPVQEVLRPLQWMGHRGVAAVAAGRWRGKGFVDIDAAGGALQTLEAALWALGRSGSFREAVVTAVNLGEAAPAIGAVTGQLAGAIWGVEAIPEEWLEPLACRERVEALARSLARVAEERPASGLRRRASPGPCGRRRGPGPARTE